MANLTGKTISEFPALSDSSVTDFDLFPVSSGGATKKITFANLVSAIKTAIKVTLTGNSRINTSGSGAVIIQRSPNSSNETAQMALDANGTISTRKSTDGGSTWSAWKTIAAGDYVVIDSVTASAPTEISAGSASGLVQIACAKTGYTPVGIVGITKSGTSSSWCFPYEFRISGNNANLYFRNIGTSDASITATAYVLYRLDI